jgi:hypothetical protein
VKATAHDAFGAVPEEKAGAEAEPEPEPEADDGTAPVVVTRGGVEAWSLGHAARSYVTRARTDALPGRDL